MTEQQKSEQQAQQQNGHPAPADLGELIHDMHAGVFAQKVNRALAAVALGVTATGKKGELTLKFSLERIADGNQVTVKHCSAFVLPTERGKRTEQDTTETAFHVGAGGRLSLYPTHESRDLFPGKGDGVGRG